MTLCKDCTSATWNNIRRAPAVFCLCALVAGCGARFESPSAPVEVPEKFSAGGTATAPKRWWTALGDENLDKLMDEALCGNLTLRAAWDRLRQAQAQLQKSAAPLLPSVTGDAAASRTVSRTEMLGKTYETEFSLGLSASYEVDLWGRVRSTYDATELDARASEQDVLAAALTLSGQVAATWYRIVELRGQLDLLDEQIRTNSEFLDVITVKFRQGQVLAADVLQQREVLQERRGQRQVVFSQLAVACNALAVLLGRAPGGYRTPEGKMLPKLPELPSTGVPARWVSARPDVRAAQLRVMAADRRTAAAIAEQFPKLTLTAGADASDERIRDLFDNWLASMAAGLTAPVFDAGLREAEVRRSRAAAAEILHNYGQTVLEAVAEVENALAGEEHQRQYVESLRKQLDLSAKSLEQIRRNYIKGAEEFTRYLTSRLLHQQLASSYLRARRELLDRRIDLYRALGRGWGLSPPPEPPRRVRGPIEKLLPRRKGNNDSPESEENED